MEFEERFVAFLDILGFSEIIRDQDEICRIIDIVKTETINAKTPGNHGIFPNERIRATYISDSIVLSISVGQNSDSSYKNLRYLLHAVEQIQYQCALKDVWIRGGISWGSLSHDQNVVGEGLVKAYRLETTARFPRVLFDMDIITGFFERKYDGPTTRTDLLSQINLTWGAEEYSGTFLFDREKLESPFHGVFQDDGLLFVNYMNSIYNQVPSPARRKLIDSLRKRLYRAATPEVHAKYLWVVHYLLTLAPRFEHRAECMRFFAKLQAL